MFVKRLVKGPSLTWSVGSPTGRLLLLLELIVEGPDYALLTVGGWIQPRHTSYQNHC